jgi:uncharacterized protein YbjT (DUF2867 family)
MAAPTTFVLGGTGKTGRRVAERLWEQGLAVRIGSRSGEPPFDWDAPSTWPAAVKGARAVYLSYYPDVAAPGAAESIESFTELAVKSGVLRLVLLSGRGAPEAERCEQIVRRAALEWTIVRASWFNQNFSENFLLDSVLAGEMAVPAGNVGEPFVDADDIADVAVAALTGKGHAGQIYEVTGPELWTFADATAEIARATGRDIRYVNVPIKSYEAALVEAQLPPAAVGLITYLFSDLLDGRNASVADGVWRALGRPARDFRSYVENTVSSGIWQAG